MDNNMNNMNNMNNNELFLNFLSALLGDSHEHNTHNEENKPRTTPTPKTEPKETSFIPDRYKNIAHNDMFLYKALLNEGFRPDMAFELLLSHISNS